MAEKSLGDSIIGWYGNIAAKNLDNRPKFTRNWLMLGFRLETKKVEVAPDKRFLPSGQHGYALFMSSVVDAMRDAENSVVTSIFTPPEVFRALGLKPMCAEAVASFVSGAQAEGAFLSHAEGTGIPETYCSYHRALMGMAASGVLRPRKLVASTSVACDANNLSFKMLASKWGAENCYIDVPYDVSEEAIRYVADQLREMAAQASEIYGRRLDDALLRQLVARSLETDDALERTLPLRRGRYLANTMTLDMMEMLDLQLSLGTPEALELALGMESDFAKAKRFSGVSLVWAHVSPYFLGSIGGILDCQPTAQIVASDMMFNHLTPPEGRTFDADQPFEAMAERVVRNCFNGPSTRRADTLVRLASETDADGVVIFCHWGCKETAGAAQLMRRQIEAAGWPVLVLDGDAVDRANCMEGQMSTRFSAFMELLASKKEEKERAHV
ncbi:MAG: 2-hydroxyacyl-CoA dehydratase subunit D [Tractidigestivibacter sp.]|jgi:benzoyl-CoA reductase/2-hydroxyglutaryl-CoA dehydratase subunit BcrC/BadD/HgdB|uniref:2-hydroxyacyl-CoA dehydratase subunit D n=1 Tax=Tractidigestivibacter sp. TaxID=2847320 RepID=UPI003D9068A7